MPIKTPLRKIKQLHQALEGTNVCIYCGLPMEHWKAMEVCQDKVEYMSKHYGLTYEQVTAFNKKLEH